MDKFEQLTNDYLKVADVADSFCASGAAVDLKPYIESCALRVWGRDKGPAEEYPKAIKTLTGKDLTAQQISEAAAKAGEESGKPDVPEFFKTMVEKDVAKTDIFIGALYSLLVSLAYINGDFTIEETAEVERIVGGLSNYATANGRRRSDFNYGARDNGYLSNVFGALNDLLDMTAGGVRPADKKPKDAVIEPVYEPLSDGALDDFKDEMSKLAGKENKEEVAQAKEPEVPRTEEELNKLLEELDSLVGMDNIKSDVHSLMNFIKIMKMREERGMEKTKMSYHLVFTGNPGTGKTTIARLIASLYYQIGVLPKGQLVEVDRSQLVAGYVGQTAIKTQKVLQQAMGGVLFIDEAYSLTSNEQDTFGAEAVETILKAMEDHRDELVVIVAGYPELMHKFIDSNPGLSSRFNKYFEFADYNGDELLGIFKRFCDKNGYTIDSETELMLKTRFDQMYENRDDNFGNARTIRNIFEKAISVQADRLAGTENAVENVTDEQLQIITAEDLEKAMDQVSRL